MVSKGKWSQAKPTYMLLSRLIPNRLLYSRKSIMPWIAVDFSPFKVRPDAYCIRMSTGMGRIKW